MGIDMSDETKKIGKLKPGAEAMDFSVLGELTDEEKKELDLIARKQVEEELRNARKKEFIRQQVLKYRNANIPGEKIVSITLDLPGHANSIVLDGKYFFHGVTYKVAERVYKTMIDIQARAWEHENEIGGANRDLYKGRAPVNPVVTPTGITQDNPIDHTRIAPMVKF